jgi:hypothetical protein
VKPCSVLDARSSESGQGLVVNIVYSDSERAKSVVDASKPVLDAVPAALPEPESDANNSQPYQKR